jgi:glycosyltransferase involved in cell wall biosynthesis
VREEWGIPADVPLAGMVGRLVDWKGPDYFLRAAALVAEDLEEARFMLVGDALFGERAYVEELKALVRELGIEERVVFTGFREDVEDVMGCLDLVVHASVLPDPLPTVLIEALGMGLPVVATEGGGVREIVENGECGLVVPPRDVGAMAEAMKTLLRDGELAARMGEEGRRKVQATFDPEVTSRELQEELLRLLEVRKPREGRRGPRGRWRA